MINSQPKPKKKLPVRLWADSYFSKLKNEIGACSLLESKGLDANGEPIVVCIVDRGIIALVVDDEVPDRMMVAKQLSVPESHLPQIILVRQRTDQRPAVFSRSTAGAKWTLITGSTDEEGAVTQLRAAVRNNVTLMKVAKDVYQPKHIIEALNEMHQSQVLEPSVRGLLSVIDR